jgi:hypothetical protein
VRLMSAGRQLVCSNQEWALDFACDVLTDRPWDSHPGHRGRFHPRVPDSRDGYEIAESARISRRASDRAVLDTGVDSL